MNIRSVKRIALVYRALSAIRSALLGGYMRICNKADGISSNKVAFSSFKGQSFSDSPRAIAEALHEMRPNTDIVFQLPGNADAPGWVRRAAPASLSWLREISTARVLVDNFNRPFYQKKFSGQNYVQTWHGDRGFKKVLFDKNGKENYPDGRYMDLAVAGSDFCESMYRTAFRYKGEVLKTGLPRNDCLTRPMEISAARGMCGLPKDKKVLLYAPTFRDSHKGGALAGDLNLEWVQKTLSEITGDSWICACRAHSENSSVAGAAIDLTDYPDMAVVMQACDALITDYSSCAGDFAMLGRPVVLWHAGRTFERDLYFEIASSPFWAAKSENELREIFRKFNESRENDRAILEFFGTRETGGSARDVAARICEWLDKENVNA